MRSTASLSKPPVLLQISATASPMGLGHDVIFGCVLGRFHEHGQRGVILSKVLGGLTSIIS
jgi:hypothetical protein